MSNQNEPKSGWNLPAGVYEDDPHFTGEDRTCGTCRHCIEECCDYGFCSKVATLSPRSFGDWEDMFDFIDTRRVDMQEDTCESWEA